MTTSAKDALSGDASEEHPVYTIIPHDGQSATPVYYITCNEGWRSHIVCERMYRYVAEWLVEILQGKPYAEER